LHLIRCPPFHSSTAIAIITEHSFYLWDQAPSREPKSFISAIIAYQSSTKHTIITQAIDEIFEEHKEHFFNEAKDSDNPTKSAFASQLVQIALDNRLSMSYQPGAI
jgi:hypothetical protein